MTKLKSVNVCVAATQKQKSKTAYFGISMTRKQGKKTAEYSGMFQAESRMETQLKAMIHSLNLVEDAEEIILISDSKFVDSFLDGTVSTWELADWCKGNGKTIDCAECWKELNGLVESLNVTFQKPKNKKEMAQANKLMNGEKDKPEVFTALNLGSLSNDSEGIYDQESTDFIVNEIKREVTSELNQEETDDLIAKAIAKAIAISNTANTAQGKNGGAGLLVDIDEKTLAECDAFFQELGLDTATAVKLFLKQSLRSQSIPFQLKLEN